MDLPIALLSAIFGALFLGPCCSRMCVAPVLVFAKDQRRQEEEFTKKNAATIAKVAKKGLRRANRRADRIARATAEGLPPPVTERKSKDGRSVTRGLAVNPAYFGTRDRNKQQRIVRQEAQRREARQEAADSTSVAAKEADLYARQQRRGGKKKWAEGQEIKPTVCKASEHLVAQIQTAQALDSHEKEVHDDQHRRNMKALNRKLRTRREAQFAEGYKLPALVAVPPGRGALAVLVHGRHHGNNKVHVAPHLVSTSAEC